MNNLQTVQRLQHMKLINVFLFFFKAFFFPAQWCISQTTSMGADKGSSLLLHPRNLIICSLILLDPILSLISQKARRQEVVTHQALKMLLFSQCTLFVQQAGTEGRVYTSHIFAFWFRNIKYFAYLRKYYSGEYKVFYRLYR